jgi:hypothetical protein
LRVAASNASASSGTRRHTLEPSTKLARAVLSVGESSFTTIAEVQ